MSQGIPNLTNSHLDIHGYPWIGQMIPTGFGYGYSQSGMPPHSQPKAEGDLKMFHDLGQIMFSQALVGGPGQIGLYLYFLIWGE